MNKMTITYDNNYGNSSNSKSSTYCSSDDLTLSEVVSTFLNSLPEAGYVNDVTVEIHTGHWSGESERIELADGIVEKL